VGISGTDREFVEFAARFADNDSTEKFDAAGRAARDEANDPRG
jgi:hypothetical protein